MKGLCKPACGVLACAIALAPPAPAAPALAAAAEGETFSYGRFGEVSVYRSSAEPREVVLFLSGDGGWNLGVVSMAKLLAAKGAIVAGFNIRRYMEQLEASAEACVSPGVDLENLSRELQSRFSVTHYLRPTLVGYSSGATLVYATLAEAPAGVFKGALSLGFCPDLDLRKPVCKGSGIESTPRRDSHGVLKGVDFLPAKTLPRKWISLQGELDQVCAPAATQKFISLVPGAELIMLPKVGHGYSVERNWVPQYEAAFDRITQADAAVKPPAPAAP
jgi:type IV secretory pathway VirJ component